MITWGVIWPFWHAVAYFMLFVMIRPFLSCRLLLRASLSDGRTGSDTSVIADELPPQTQIPGLVLR